MEGDVRRVARLPSVIQLTRAMPLFFRHRLAQAGFWVLALIATLSLFGPWLFGNDAFAPDASRMYLPPSAEHLLGTDQLGRDLFLRVLEGGRVSLLTGLAATLLATLFGCFYGIVSGMASGWLDRILMGFLDALISIPVILLVIVSQAFGESSLLKVTLVIALASWMGTARMMRTECRTLMEADFIKAAIAGGASSIRLVFRHLLPNTLAPLVVVVTVGVGQSILLESTLSFLNLGVPATVPSWGNLLGNGMSSVLSGAWWMVLFPGLSIVLTVLAINLIGDGLRDTIDPKHRSQY
ncbi:MAG: ABC transporter permease [Gammaproteobacteria bacterium]|nr:ABC transporter permease [Gammaproteobacteria bacterium]